ncbi:MAG: DUF4157 domain-containing protein [Bacteroidota bacterium]
MKTAEAKTTANIIQRKNDPAQHPFFSKEGESHFFADEHSFSPSGEGRRGDTKPFFSPSNIQPKLTIGQPNDKFEIEADQMADQVVQRLSNKKARPEDSKPAAQMEQSDILHRQVGSSKPPSIQHKCADCEGEERLQKMEGEEEMLSRKEISIQRKPIFESNDDENNNAISSSLGASIQRKCATCEQEDEMIQEKSETSSPNTASTDLQNRLNRTKGSGAPLPKETASSLGEAFGTDFSNVRIHTGSEAVQMSQELGAQAFTHGSDIYFNKGKYETGSTSGQHLLAHELVHTVQQGGSKKVHPKIQRSPNRFPKDAPVILTLQDKLEKLKKGDYDNDPELKYDIAKEIWIGNTLPVKTIDLNTGDLMLLENVFTNNSPKLEEPLNSSQDILKSLRNGDYDHCPKIKYALAKKIWTESLTDRTATDLTNEDLSFLESIFRKGEITLEKIAVNYSDQSPYEIPNSLIRQSKEYQNMMVESGKYQDIESAPEGTAVTAAEGLETCRILIDRINKCQNVDWPKDAAETISQARANLDAEVVSIYDDSPYINEMPGTLFFELNSSEVPNSQIYKIAEIIRQNPSELTLRGAASKNEKNQEDLVDRRLAAVQQILDDLGYTGAIINTENRYQAGEEMPLYNRVRAVEMLHLGNYSLSNLIDCKAGEEVPSDGKKRKEIRRTLKHAKGDVKKAIALLKDPSDRVLGLVDQFFHDPSKGEDLNWTIDELRKKLKEIKGQLNMYVGEKIKNHNYCDDTCNLAYAYNKGIWTKAVMVLCPGFWEAPYIERVYTIIHEAIHGAKNIEGQDWAYDRSRKLAILPKEKAFNNNDSYVMFIKYAVGSLFSPKDPGTNIYYENDEIEATCYSPEKRATIDFLLAELETELLDKLLAIATMYETMSSLIDETEPHQQTDHKELKKVADITGLVSTSDKDGMVKYTQKDLTAVAALWERVEAMKISMFTENKNISTDALAHKVVWDMGPGENIAFYPAFFAKTSEEQMQELYAALIHATPHVSENMEPKLLDLLGELSYRKLVEKDHKHSVR